MPYELDPRLSKSLAYSLYLYYLVIGYIFYNILTTCTLESKARRAINKAMEELAARRELYSICGESTH